MMSNLSSNEDLSTDSDALDSGQCSECMVKVKAQVMTRDGGTNLWCPLKGRGSGMSEVQLARVVPPSDQVENDCDTSVLRTPTRDSPAHHYHIVGQKDNEMVLKCVVTKDLQYTHATPTFHHWQTDMAHRYGLTFQSPSEAEAFEKAVASSVEMIRTESRPPTEVSTPVRTQAILESPPPFSLSCKKLEALCREADEREERHRVATEASTSMSSAATSAIHEKPESKDESFCGFAELAEALPVVPPRRPNLPPAARPAAIEVEILPAVPPRSALNQPLLSHHRPPRYTQSLNGVSSQHARKTTPSVAQCHRTQSVMPPVPPRPDLFAAPVRESHLVDMTRAVPVGAGQSHSLVDHARSAHDLPVRITDVTHHHLSQLPTANAAAASTSAMNYVYFTDGNTPPPVVSLSSVAKPAKMKPDAASRKHSIDVIGRDVGRRLADSAVHSGADDGSGGAYVRLALPPTGIVDISENVHDYCYPSIDTVVPAPSLSAMVPAEPQREPPPLPTKSRAGWRHRRRHAARPSFVTASRRPSYGTDDTTLSAASSARLSSDGSNDCRRSCKSSFLCLVMPCVRPCRHHRRRSIGKRRSTTAAASFRTTRESVA